jgi:hypothetical protein
LVIKALDPDPEKMNTDPKHCLFDPWILDPGWGKIKIRSRDELPGSYIREIKNNFFELKYLNSSMQIRIRDPESYRPWIRDPG